MIVFEVEYEVLRAVDQHPTGCRIRSTQARNWMEACDNVRKVYGEDKQGNIRVDAVTTRNEKRERVYHYSRWGHA